MKFGLNIPLARVHPDFQSPAAVAEVAAALEQSRAASGHLTDHPAPSANWLHNDPTGHDSLDPFTGLAFIAARTTRLKLQTSVIVLPYRNPFLVAKSAATLQVLSGGRLLLGVGVGYQKREFGALGVPFEKRGAMADEALETIKLAWAGGTVVKQGVAFNATGNEPRPVPSPPPPIWVGGGSDKAVERAARFGDGWAPFLARPTGDRYVGELAIKTLDELREKIGRVGDLREKHGRPRDCDIIIAPPYYPKTRARPDVEKYCDAIRELGSLGVTWIVAIVQAPSMTGYKENLAWFSDEIIAQLDDA